jgi:hypothetical protein
MDRRIADQTGRMPSRGRRRRKRDDGDDGAAGALVPTG